MEILFNLVFFHQILGTLDINFESTIGINKGSIDVMEVGYPRMGHDKFIKSLI